VSVVPVVGDEHVGAPQADERHFLVAVETK
jgi:hypothetical protein